MKEIDLLELTDGVPFLKKLNIQTSFKNLTTIVNKRKRGFYIKFSFDNNVI